MLSGQVCSMLRRAQVPREADPARIPHLNAAASRRPAQSSHGGLRSAASTSPPPPPPPPPHRQRNSPRALRTPRHRLARAAPLADRRADAAPVRHARRECSPAARAPRTRALALRGNGRRCGAVRCGYGAVCCPRPPPKPQPQPQPPRLRRGLTRGPGRAGPASSRVPALGAGRSPTS